MHNWSICEEKYTCL